MKQYFINNDIEDNKINEIEQTNTLVEQDNLNNSNTCDIPEYFLSVKSS